MGWSQVLSAESQEVFVCECDALLTHPGGWRAWGCCSPTSQYLPSCPHSHHHPRCSFSSTPCPEFLNPDPASLGALVQPLSCLQTWKMHGHTPAKSCHLQAAADCPAVWYSSVNAIYLAIWYHGHSKHRRMQLPKEILYLLLFGALDSVFMHSLLSFLQQECEIWAGKPSWPCFITWGYHLLQGTEFPAMPASPVPDPPLSRAAASNIWEMSQPSQAKHMGLKARNWAAGSNGCFS